MDDRNLKEYNEEQANNKLLRMLADSIYTEAREKHSRKEIFSRPQDFIINEGQHSVTDEYIIKRHIECLCASEYDPSEPYEYSLENRYDPAFMDKFTDQPYLYLNKPKLVFKSVVSKREPNTYFYVDLTDELFGDENRAALDKRQTSACRKIKHD